MVFDTEHPTGNKGQSLCQGYDNGNDGDPDLGTPNSYYGGPGHGSGGGPGPYANTVPLGNSLIIQESNKACPDDSGTGGWLHFDFLEPTEVSFAKMLDIDDYGSCVIRYYYAGGGYNDYTVPETNDNGVIDVNINKQNIIKVRIYLPGSGSIAQLNYRFCPPGN